MTAKKTDITPKADPRRTPWKMGHFVHENDYAAPPRTSVGLQCTALCDLAVARAACSSYAVLKGLK